MGLRYLVELGLPPEEHTQIVDSIYEGACQRARGLMEDEEVEPYCLHYKQKAVAEVLEMAKAGFTLEDLEEAIEGLSFHFRWAAEVAVSSYL